MRGRMPPCLCGQWVCPALRTSAPQDIVLVREALEQIRAAGGGGALPKLGAMIETPAAALSVPFLAPHVAFLSFGTNDLAQYAFAADRENTAVDMYFNDSDAVIFRLLRIAHDDAPQLPFSICGELARRAVHIPKILRCGITALSVTRPLVSVVKEAVRSSSTRWSDAHAPPPSTEQPSMADVPMEMGHELTLHHDPAAPPGSRVTS